MTTRASILPRRPKAATRSGSPQMTSLVDMMVILLVFLLKSFSVEGQLVTPAKDLMLPESSSTVTAEPALSVEVTTSGVQLAGQLLVSLDDLATDDELVIDRLANELALVTVDADPTGDPRPVSVQCDRRVDFRILKKVLYTCNQAGLTDLSLLVLTAEL